MTSGKQKAKIDSNSESKLTKFTFKESNGKFPQSRVMTHRSTRKTHRRKRRYDEIHTIQEHKANFLIGKNQAKMQKIIAKIHPDRKKLKANSVIALSLESQEFHTFHSYDLMDFFFFIISEHPFIPLKPNHMHKHVRTRHGNK